MNHEKSLLPNDISCRLSQGVRRCSVSMKQLWGTLPIKVRRRVAGLRLLQCKRVMWGAVNQSTSEEVRWLTERCWVCWEFRRASTAWGTKVVKGDPTAIFSVALTKRTMGIMALKQGRWPCATGSSCRLYYLMGWWWFLCFWMSTQRAFPSFSYTKRKRGIW